MTSSDAGPRPATGTSPASLAGFAGRWAMARHIAHADGLRGALEGVATVAPSGPGLFTYDEDGTLRLGAAEPLRATRRYFWRSAGDAVAIFFADGRPFHRIAFGAMRPETTHLCPPDRYRVVYDFTAWPVWSAHWRVEGPRKRYEMTTTYRPAGPLGL
ncbi:MAG: DUF6314 family protein [Paracoccaceae bacterium]|nr:DUF6314 family protein [Paracoccaceae bacterium]